jgi:uncharacterized protein (UPF0248 family)
MLRDLLNRLRWDAGSVAVPTVLAIRVREGREEHIREIDFDSVTEILPRGFLVADGTFLPYHRVVAVRRGEEVLWRSSGE